MKKIISYLIVVGMCVVAFFNTGCKKEYITEEHITEEHITQQFLNLDSLKIAKGLLTGKWINQHTTVDNYTGTTVSLQWVEFFPAGNTTVEYKSDSTYITYNKGTPAGNGVWKLISPSYLSMDIGNNAQERYYFVRILDGHVLALYGPFKKDGSFFFGNSVNTAYYLK